MANDFKLDLNEGALRDIVADSIMKLLTDDKRKEIMTESLKWLLAPVEKGGYYGNKRTSPLEDSFNEAVRQFVQKLMQKEVEENLEFQAKLKALISEGYDKFFAEGDRRHTMVHSIADNIGKALSGER